jgi:prefoldin subunit 5
MNNTHLSRRINNAKRELESIIDELIAEVEQLESDNGIMQREINSLNDTIEEIQQEL